MTAKQGDRVHVKVDVEGKVRATYSNAFLGDIVEVETSDGTPLEFPSKFVEVIRTPKVGDRVCGSFGLDGLPVYTVIADADGGHLMKGTDGRWWSNGYGGFSFAGADLPAWRTIKYLP